MTKTQRENACGARGQALRTCPPPPQAQQLQRTFHSLHKPDSFRRSQHNRHRLHSALQYRPPEEFELIHNPVDRLPSDHRTLQQQLSLNFVSQEGGAVQ
jgi:hypothetical protein